MQENGFMNMKLKLMLLLLFSKEKHTPILCDYKLSTYLNYTSLNITEQELDDYIEEDIEKLIGVPFHILIDIYAEYINRFNYTSQSEEEIIEDGEPVKITQAFKTDQYVICLTNQLNILFYDCMHIWTCLECKELNPLNSCPYCRATAIENICI